MTKEIAQQLFYYKDGKLFRKNNDIECGYVDKSTGYRRFRYSNKIYYIHRIIFLLDKGYLPKYIDHIDGDKINNKLENLRECTQQQNSYNSKTSKNNKLGIKGISVHKHSGLYRAVCRINKKCITIGYYKDLNNAILNYNNFIATNHKEYAKFN
jgi:hypothetical protein